jgi:hypothetical protein
VLFNASLGEGCRTDPGTTRTTVLFASAVCCGNACCRSRWQPQCSSTASHPQLWGQLHCLPLLCAVILRCYVTSCSLQVKVAATYPASWRFIHSFGARFFSHASATNMPSLPNTLIACWSISPTPVLLAAAVCGVTTEYAHRRSRLLPRTQLRAASSTALVPAAWPLVGSSG